jgi:hypothetical protein
MRISSAAKLTLLFALASLLPLIHSQVVAQADDIPDTVLVTGSLIRGVTMPPPRSPHLNLTQLTDDELKSLLPGSELPWGNDRFYLGCDGRFGQTINAIIRTFSTGRYSIRDSQICFVHDNSSPSSCAKLFRNDAGELFYDPYSPVQLVPPDQACPQ